MLDASIPQRLTQGLELAVGVVVLGADVIRRILADRVHFHIHRHADGATHFHAHPRRSDKAHGPDHYHAYPRGLPVRALMVGLMRGMAGSAALILLALQTVRSPLNGLLYMLLFGVGSILGMALLSVIIAVPMRYSGRGITWQHNGVQGLIGVATFGLGLCSRTRSGYGVS